MQAEHGNCNGEVLISDRMAGASHDEGGLRCWGSKGLELAEQMENPGLGKVTSASGTDQTKENIDNSPCHGQEVDFAVFSCLLLNPQKADYTTHEQHDRASWKQQPRESRRSTGQNIA